MDSIQRLSRTVVLLGIVFQLSAATVQAEVVEFAAFMDGVCAGSGVAQKGWGSFNLDTTTGIVTFRIDYDSTLSPRFAHVHGPIADACLEPANGPIVYFLPEHDNPMLGSVTLTALEQQDMLAGLHYANFHTDQFPDALITGQIVPVTKNRFLSVVPSATAATSTAATQAICVILRSLHHPTPAYPIGTVTDFTAFENEVRWLGPPQSFVDRPFTFGSFWVSQLQCTPHFMDWKGLAGIVHVNGAEVIPSSKYEIQFADDTCADLADPLCYNEPMKVRTARWGDAVTPYAGIGVGQPNFGDIRALVETFMGSPLSVGLARAQLYPNVASPVSNQLNFQTISYGVAAFQGKGYSFAGPSHCGP